MCESSFGGIKWFVDQPQKGYFLLFYNMHLTNIKRYHWCHHPNFTGDGTLYIILLCWLFEKVKDVRIIIEEIKQFFNHPQKGYHLLVCNMCLTKSKPCQFCQLSYFSGDCADFIAPCWSLVKEKVKDVRITTGQIKWFVNHLQKWQSFVWMQHVTYSF